MVQNTMLVLFFIFFFLHFFVQQPSNFVHTQHFQLVFLLLLHGNGWGDDRDPHRELQRPRVKSEHHGLRVQSHAGVQLRRP